MGSSPSRKTAVRWRTGALAVLGSRLQRGGSGYSSSIQRRIADESATRLGCDLRGQGRGVVCLDYDRDGDLDLFIANNGEAPRLLGLYGWVEAGIGLYALLFPFLFAAVVSRSFCFWLHQSSYFQLPCLSVLSRLPR